MSYSYFQTPEKHGHAILLLSGMVTGQEKGHWGDKVRKTGKVDD